MKWSPYGLICRGCRQFRTNGRLESLPYDFGPWGEMGIVSGKCTMRTFPFTGR